MVFWPTLHAEERAAVAAVAVLHSGLDATEVEALLLECEAPTAAVVTAAIAELAGLSRSRTLDLLAECYRIVTADGELHPGEVSLLSRAITLLFGAANVEQCLKWLQSNDIAATLRADLEHVEDAQ